MVKFASIPRCYLTILTDNQETLLLQDIKTLGFQLYDRKTVMNLDHIKLVLKVLGQWHALSFGLQAKHPLEFSKLTFKWKCPAEEIFVKSHVGKWMNLAQKHLLSVLADAGELELLLKYKKKTNNHLATSIVKDILYMQKEHVVVTHGDCWNNNLMFKYQVNELVLLEIFQKKYLFWISRVHLKPHQLICVFWTSKYPLYLVQ